MERLLRPVMSRRSSRPAATASSTTYWIAGLSTIGSISLGVAFVAGRNRVPRPAAGTTALVTGPVSGMFVTLAGAAGRAARGPANPGGRVMDPEELDATDGPGAPGGLSVPGGPGGLSVPGGPGGLSGPGALERDKAALRRS